MFTQTLRPFSWDDIVGQKGIVKEMKRRSKTMDFPEVMLFEGASGTGKSTMAFIISALLSDKNPIVHEDGTKDPNPESLSSKAILDMKFNRDVIYKDASNMTKEDVLALQRDISNAPMYDGVKVVVIDECFHENTLVTTKSGKKRIANIKEGEEVLTSDGFYPVRKVFKNSILPERLCLVRIDGKEILTTVDHLFMTKEGWTEAGQLKTGTELFKMEVKQDGKIISSNLQAMWWEVLYGEENTAFRIPRVESVEVYKRGSNDQLFRGYFSDYELSGVTVPMYDLEVEEVHNYVVNDILVHNCQELGKASKGATLTLLEKKRKNTYLILCTMDIDKLDKAIRSRASVYTFKSPSSSDIAELLMTYTDENHLNLPFDDSMKEFYEKGIFMLAENCEGSVRMAVQNFERCVQGGFFTVADIEREFTILSNDKLSELIVKLCNRKAEVIKEIKDFGAKDFYYKLMKTLGDAYLYSKTGYLDAPWKKALASKLSSYSLYPIIEELQKAELNGFFREDLFFTSLTKAFFDSGRIPVGITPSVSSKRTPVGIA